MARIENVRWSSRLNSRVVCEQREQDELYQVSEDMDTREGEQREANSRLVAE